MARLIRWLRALFTPRPLPGSFPPPDRMQGWLGQNARGLPERE